MNSCLIECLPNELVFSPSKLSHSLRIRNKHSAPIRFQVKNLTKYFTIHQNEISGDLAPGLSQELTVSFKGTFTTHSEENPISLEFLQISTPLKETVNFPIYFVNSTIGYTEKLMRNFHTFYDFGTVNLQSDKATKHLTVSLTNPYPFQLQIEWKRLTACYQFEVSPMHAELKNKGDTAVFTLSFNPKKQATYFAEFEVAVNGDTKIVKLLGNAVSYAATENHPDTENTSQDHQNVDKQQPLTTKRPSLPHVKPKSHQPVDSETILQNPSFLSIHEFEFGLFHKIAERDRLLSTKMTRFVGLNPDDCIPYQKEGDEMLKKRVQPLLHDAINFKFTYEAFPSTVCLPVQLSALRRFAVAGTAVMVQNRLLKRLAKLRAFLSKNKIHDKSSCQEFVGKDNFKTFSKSKKSPLYQWIREYAN
jgi:hypothetical protein